ncbi:MAG TPA: hypothetical protein VKA21_15210 [Candidatus Binatia bacterium]|nr:hypothetical protein [Candidatus Binatia bacterium]
MRRSNVLAVALVAPAVLAVALVAPAAAALSPELDRALKDSKYVYVQSERKSGELGKPAEIWFHYDGKSLWVGTPPTSWRVKRVKAGRKKARIAVGKADGPAFDATAEVVRDPAVEQQLMTEYAKKYPEGWSRFAEKFRDGFKTGDRVLVRYTPK